VNKTLENTAIALASEENLFLHVTRKQRDPK